METPTTSPAHNEGPWEYQPSSGTIRDRSNHWIATMDSFDGAVDNHANGRLIAAAPNLLKLARSFQCSCEDRIAILREEREQDFADKKDIDTQIGHWSFLLNRCESVLKNAV